MSVEPRAPEATAGPSYWCGSTSGFPKQTKMANGAAGMIWLS